MREIIQKLIKPVATAECALAITEDGGVIFVRLQPGTGDVPRFIGRSGATVRALKALVEYAAPDNKVVRFSLGDGIQSPAPVPVPRNEKWRPDDIVEIVEAYLDEIGEPAAVQTVAQTDGWLLILAAVMPREVWDALSRWITVMALSTGGYAALEPYDVAQ